MALQNGDFVTAAAERDGAAETGYTRSYYLQDPSQHFFSRIGFTLFILQQAMRHLDSRKGELCLVALELWRTEKETVHTIILRLGIVISDLREKLRELKE